MTLDQVRGTVAGLPAVGRAFRDRRHSEISAAPTPSGRQEATVLVTRAYTTSLITVKHGTPVRLKFIRQGTAARSEEVVFPDLARRVRLPDGELVPVDFTPEQAGEYEFTSGEASLHGKIIAE
ncbi:MAG TPA: cupredoxin domain-containing protein [Solirubrobacteraceae bacterium]|nr:cupredoxin domain-containing protein [Solirubrobacteraceae bacterium]